MVRILWQAFCEGVVSDLPLWWGDVVVIEHPAKQLADGKSVRVQSKSHGTAVAALRRSGVYHVWMPQWKPLQFSPPEHFV